MLLMAPAMLTQPSPRLDCHWKVNCGLLRPSASTMVAVLAVRVWFCTSSPVTVGPAVGALFADESTISSVPLASWYTARTRMFSPATSSVTR
ncbi:hypothetical protein D3C81_1046780 [compost metagenome]